MGARILSVVDCFDALTSDRPYRPRLSTSDATRILLERRGTMYDPLVVDTFLQVHDQLIVDAVAMKPSPDAELITLSTRPISNSSPGTTPAGLVDIAASTEEMLVLYDLARGLLGRLEFSDAAEIISRHLRRIVPASTCVIFLVRCRVRRTRRITCLRRECSTVHGTTYPAWPTPDGVGRRE